MMQNIRREKHNLQSLLHKEHPPPCSSNRYARAISCATKHAAVRSHYLPDVPLRHTILCIAGDKFDDSNKGTGYKQIMLVNTLERVAAQ